MDRRRHSNTAKALKSYAIYCATWLRCSSGQRHDTQNVSMWNSCRTLWLFCCWAPCQCRCPCASSGFHTVGVLRINCLPNACPACYSNTVSQCYLTLSISKETENENKLNLRKVICVTSSYLSERPTALKWFCRRWTLCATLRCAEPNNFRAPSPPSRCRSHLSWHLDSIARCVEPLPIDLPHWPHNTNAASATRTDKKNVNE